LTRTGEAQAEVARRLRWQSRACRLLGSALYEHLLGRVAADVEAGGPAWAVLKGHEEDPPDSMLGLRLMAAVHRLVLQGMAPGIARFYPSVGGRLDLGRVWPAFEGLLAERCEDLSQLIERPCQTNEVGRSAGLLGGFLLVAGRAGLPLRVLEIGASAGLNLCFDRYFYTAGAQTWGDPASPVRFVDFVSEGRLPLDQPAAIAERRGCDSRALDPASAEDRLTLTAAVWADQMERVRHLRAALELVGRAPPPVDRAGAGEWLEHQLAMPAEGVATVVFHSLVWQYLGERERDRVVAAIEGAGANATDDSPLAWLRMERGGELAEVRLTAWPGGRGSVVALAGYHGRPVRWLGD
jgi:hypothetical protein